MTERPYYIDDPLVDISKHRLGLHVDLVESAKAGHDLAWGCCSCGGWSCPVWDSTAVLGAFDEHMTAVQDVAHRTLRQNTPPAPDGP